MMHMQFQDATHPEDRLQTGHSLDEWIAGEIYVKNQEKRYRHKSGHFLRVNVTSSMVRDGEGKPTICSTGSHRKQIAEER
jgi:diguanylate cyclase